VSGALRLRFRDWAAIACAFGATAAAAEGPPANVRNFVACPIVRDTATVPCWLSEHEGELYYLGIQTDVSAPIHPPLLGHKVIVEGVVADGRRICGGIVLDPVQLSPVSELDANCNQLWPAEDRYTIDFNPRPPGPSEGRLAFAGPPASGGEAATPAPRSFTVYYYHDGLVSGRNSGTLNAIVDYAVAIAASKVVISAHQGDILLSDGSILAEREGLAQARAEELGRLLKAGGLEAEQWRVSWSTGLAPDGVEDWKARRADVRVEP
jgi:hypothetical protein